jgi:hypothetical protein
MVCRHKINTRIAEIIDLMRHSAGSGITCLSMLAGSSLTLLRLVESTEAFRQGVKLGGAYWYAVYETSEGVPRQSHNTSHAVLIDVWYCMVIASKASTSNVTMIEEATIEDAMSQLLIWSKVYIYIYIRFGICNLQKVLSTSLLSRLRQHILHGPSRLLNMQFTTAMIPAFAASALALVPRQTIARSSPRLCDDFLGDFFPYKRVDYHCCQDGNLGGCKIRECSPKARQKRCIKTCVLTS